MNVSPAQIEASYAACRRVGRQAASNFPAAFLLLPRAERRAMDAIYAFMRHTDDLVDNAGTVPVFVRRIGDGSLPAADPTASRVDDGTGATGSASAGACLRPPTPNVPKAPADPVAPSCCTSDAELNKAALDRWRAALEDALKGERHSVAANGPAVADGPVDQLGLALLPALADTVKRFQIPPQHLRAVLDGVERDLSPPCYETFADLERYCEQVASAVGLACIHVWGFRGPEALEPARAAGIALQLTNILRDLKEDARAGRVYLPHDDLRQCGYGVEDLRRGVTGPAFRRLMDLEITRATEFYRSGVRLLELLEPAGQPIFGMMMATYRVLLEQIARRPEDVFLRRVRVSRPRKWRIAARWALLPPRAAALL